MSTTGHEHETIRVSGLKTALQEFLDRFGGGDPLNDLLSSMNDSQLNPLSYENSVLVCDRGIWSFKEYTTGGGGGGGGSDYLPITGGTITGQLKVSGNYWQPFVVNSLSTGTTNTCIQFAHGGNMDSYGGILMDTVNGDLKRYDTNWNTYSIWDSGSHPTTLQGYGITDAISNSATWWGRQINNGAVTGNMTDVGSITMSGELRMPRTGGGIQFKLGNTDTYTTAMRVFQGSDVLSIGYETAQASFNTNIYGNSISMFYGTSASLGLLISSSGNVGIGQNNPSTKLDVNGTIKCTSINIGGYILSADSQNGGLHVENAGLYADTFISALGANSSSGSGTSLNEPLSSINGSGIGKPSTGTMADHAIVWTGTGWGYKYVPDNGGGGGGGGGTVTSVGMTVPTGFSVSPSSITSSDTFAVSFGGSVTRNYVLASPSSAAGAPSWRSLVADDIPDLSSIYATDDRADTLEGYFDGNGVANSALKLTTTSKTAWGQTYWTSGGVPDSISGDMSSVGNITAMTESNNYTKVITGFHSLTLRHNGSNGGHLDFFWNGALSYTSRIIEGASKRLDINDTIFVFHTSSSSNAGCVGIGTINPGYTLNVNGYTYTNRLYLASGVYLEYDNNGGVRLVGAGFYADTFVSALGANSSSGGGGIDLNTMWNALENNASTHSIGTNASRLLNLYATTGKITSINANEIGVGGFASGYQFSVIGDSSLTGFVEANGNFYVRDYAAINTAVDQNYRLKVSGNTLFDGNVGIGWYNANYKLYVNGATKIAGKLIILNSSVSSTSAEISVESVSSQSWLRVVGEDSERGIYNVGDMYVEGYAFLTGGYGSSDVRKKDILKKVECGIEDIANAPVFDFMWKSKPQRGVHLGTSAQYWRTLFLNAVTQDNDGYLAMDYGATALAAAVMTARKVVDHETRIKQLEKEIELLKAMQA